MAAHCAQLSTRSRRADQTIKSVGTVHSLNRVNRLVQLDRLGQRRCALSSNRVQIQAEGAAVTVEKKMLSHDKKRTAHNTQLSTCTHPRWCTNQTMKSVGTVHSLNRVNRCVHLERLGQRRCALSSNRVQIQAEGAAVTVEKKVLSHDKKRTAHNTQLSTCTHPRWCTNQTMKSVGTVHSPNRVNRCVHLERLGQRCCARISNLVVIQAECAELTVE
jgi:hypothetical protein